MLRGEVSYPVTMIFLRDRAQVCHSRVSAFLAVPASELLPCTSHQVIVTVLRQPLNSFSPSPSPHRLPAAGPCSGQTNSIPRLTSSQGIGAREVARRTGSISNRGLGTTENAISSDQSLRSLPVVVSQQDLTMARLELAAMADSKTETCVITELM